MRSPPFFVRHSSTADGGGGGHSGERKKPSNVSKQQTTAATANSVHSTLAARFVLGRTGMTQQQHIRRTCTMNTIWKVPTRPTTPPQKQTVQRLAFSHVRKVALSWSFSTSSPEQDEVFDTAASRSSFVSLVTRRDPGWVLLNGSGSGAAQGFTGLGQPRVGQLFFVCMCCAPFSLSIPAHRPRRLPPSQTLDLPVIVSLFVYDLSCKGRGDVLGTACSFLFPHCCDLPLCNYGRYDMWISVS